MTIFTNSKFGTFDASKKDEVIEFVRTELEGGILTSRDVIIDTFKEMYNKSIYRIPIADIFNTIMDYYCHEYKYNSDINSRDIEKQMVIKVIKEIIEGIGNLY